LGGRKEMTLKIITTAIIALMLVILPLGYVQSVQAAEPQFGNQGFIALIKNFWIVITERGSQFIGHLFEIIIVFIQIFLALLSSPEMPLFLSTILNGLNLLGSMIINGICYAVLYGITFAIYGAEIGLFVPPVIGLLFWVPFGLVIGLLFGFLYGFVYAYNVGMPATIANYS
jgi:hypothetical protein